MLDNFITKEELDERERSLTNSIQIGCAFIAGSILKLAEAMGTAKGGVGGDESNVYDGGDIGDDGDLIIYDGGDVDVNEPTTNDTVINDSGDIEVVANDEARFALTTANVQKGDVVIVTGTNKTYFVVDDTKLDIEDGYAQILVPAAPVQSVNGKTGNVTLDTDDVIEGSNNQYYTDARATLAAATYVTSTLLPDGATILHTNDEITIDAGEVTAPAGE